MNVWVASSVLSQCPAIGGWIVRAGFSVAEQLSGADIALIPSGSVDGGARYRLATATNPDAEAIRKLLADGCDDVLVEPLSEGPLRAALVLA